MKSTLEREFEIETEMGTVKGTVVLDSTCGSTNVVKVYLDNVKDILDGLKDLVKNEIEVDPNYEPQNIEYEEIDQLKDEDAESQREQDLLGD
tara:strand:- start:14410 stop:14685 length:276 start_codon:yes stop_codon:yes gene_type:complete